LVISNNTRKRNLSYSTGGSPHALHPTAELVAAKDERAGEGSFKRAGVVGGQVEDAQFASPEEGQCEHFAQRWRRYFPYGSGW